METTIPRRYLTADTSNERIWLWVAFCLYLLLTAYTMFHHELWGDELHSWNIAKGSRSISDLMYNRSYEGHPPVWYLLLWGLSRVTHQVMFMQILHWFIAGTAVHLLLFYALLPALTKVLIPFGYYFLFEYAILSRNYAIGILAAFLICILLNKEFRYKLVLYYLLMLLLSNTHLLALILGGSLHLYFLMGQFEKNRSKRLLVLHILIGFVIFLPAIYFILPPSDSSISASFLTSRWKRDTLLINLQLPLKAFVPIPAWWKYHFWNSQFMLELHSRFAFLKVVSLLVAVSLVGLCCYILRGSKKSVVLFLTNVIITFIAGNIYPPTTFRYAGFVFIGFLVACWLHVYEQPFSIKPNRMIQALLCIQLIAGVFIVSKDISLPFSNMYRIEGLVAKVPAGEKVVTDYWGVIAGNAYTDKPYYCVDLQKEERFILWSGDMKKMSDRTSRYYDGVLQYCKDRKLKQVYLFSTSSPQVLQKIDPVLFSECKVKLVSEMEDAIEKWSNLYLYQIVMP